MTRSLAEVSVESLERISIGMSAAFAPSVQLRVRREMSPALSALTASPVTASRAVSCTELHALHADGLCPSFSERIRAHTFVPASNAGGLLVGTVAGSSTVSSVPDVGAADPDAVSIRTRSPAAARAAAFVMASVTYFRASAARAASVNVGATAACT